MTYDFDFSQFLNQEEDDKQPYDSLSTRKPLEDMSLEGRIAKNQGSDERDPAAIDNSSLDALKAQMDFRTNPDDPYGQNDRADTQGPLTEFEIAKRQLERMQGKPKNPVAATIAARRNKISPQSNSFNPDPNISSNSVNPSFPQQGQSSEEVFGPPESMMGLPHDSLHYLDPLEIDAIGGPAQSNSLKPGKSDSTDQLKSLETQPKGLNPEDEDYTDPITNPVSLKGLLSQKTPESPPLDGSSDEDSQMMQDYLDQQNQAVDYRRGMNDTDLIKNIGLASAQAAQGPQTPKINTQLYSNMQRQGENMLKANTGDLDRRQKMISTIQQRNFLTDQGDKNRQNKLDTAHIMANRASGNQEMQTKRIFTGLISKINNDPIIKPSEQNLASLYKSKAILDNKDVPLTPQMLADAEMDIASALTIRSMGVTEGKIQRTELDTLGREISKARQKFTGRMVDLREERPELVKQIYDTNKLLIEDYNNTIKERRNKVIDEYDSVYGDDENFKGRLEKLRSLHNKEFEKKPEKIVFPMEVKRIGPKGPETVDIQNQQELDEAIKEGWK